MCDTQHPGTQPAPCLTHQGEAWHIQLCVGRGIRTVTCAETTRGRTCNRGRRDARRSGRAGAQAAGLAARAIAGSLRQDCRRVPDVGTTAIVVTTYRRHHLHRSRRPRRARTRSHRYWTTAVGGHLSSRRRCMRRWPTGDVKGYSSSRRVASSRSSRSILASAVVSLNSTLSTAPMVTLPPPRNTRSPSFGQMLTEPSFV